MIKEAKQLDSATVAWAEDAAVEMGFRRECVGIVAAEESDPFSFCRFAACGTEYLVMDGAVVSAVKCELVNR